MAPNIACWDLFETDITNPNTYTNPFEDVTLNATFQSPQGETTSFWGFYNGNSTWKLRFMPNQIGTWTYEAIFSDGTPGIQGQFECVSSDIPGLLNKHESNPIWFGFKNGQHFLPRSFHIGDCFFANEPNTVTGAQWNPNMRTEFLNWLQEQNYNMLSIASHYLNRQSDDRGNGWQTPNLWDTDAQIPCPSEYTRMEKVLTDLAQRKILVYPFAGLFGRNANYPTNHAKQETYIRYTLARLAPYWNLLFMVGGPEPHMQKGRYLSDEDINRIGQCIQALDPFGHLLSVHNPTGDDFFRQEDWVSYIILQGPKTIDRKKLGEDHLRNSHPNKPLYAQETLWPGNTLHSKRIGHDYTPNDIRKNAFVMLFSAAAINFADMDGLSSSGFSGRPDLALKKQPIHDIIQNVWNIFETFPILPTAPTTRPCQQRLLPRIRRPPTHSRLSRQPGQSTSQRKGPIPSRMDQCPKCNRASEVRRNHPKHTLTHARWQRRLDS